MCNYCALRRDVLRPTTECRDASGQSNDRASFLWDRAHKAISQDAACYLVRMRDVLLGLSLEDVIAENVSYLGVQVVAAPYPGCVNTGCT